MIKVCKFGGTSMANAEALKKVKDIIFADKDRKYIVVSAPGKRCKEDTKITDALYSCYDEIVKTGKCTSSFAFIRERFTNIVKDLGLSCDIKTILDRTEKEIEERKSPDFAASRGEYLSAIVMADYLGFEFVDAFDLIRFDCDGRLNEDYTDDKVSKALANIPNAVIPGFYGKASNGEIKTFSRGGSDITGSIIARGVKADLYENWTDVSGFLVCDPRIVPQSKVIEQLSYKELRELSYMGATVLHSDAIFPVMKGNIPINIKNTFKPEDKGTFIRPTESIVTTTTESRITGIAGKKDFTVIVIEKSMMNSEVGFIRKVLSVIEHYGLCVEHIPSGIDTLSIVIEAKQLVGNIDNLVSEIKQIVNPDKIQIKENIALIATVGHDINKRPGTPAKIFSALAEKGVNIKMINQGLSELNIIIGVDNKDYETCINVIYNSFIN